PISSPSLGPTSSPYTTLFRSRQPIIHVKCVLHERRPEALAAANLGCRERPALRVRRLDRRAFDISPFRAKQPLLPPPRTKPLPRSEEHTSELQSRGHLVCRLL